MITTFNNQQIIIAGGASGIGLAAALQFKAQGDVVTVTGRNTAKLTNAEAQGLTPAQVDSTNRNALEAFFKNYGPIEPLSEITR